MGRKIDQKKNRLIGAVTLFCFLTTNCVWAVPDGVSILPQSKETPAFLQVEIPKEIASIEEVYEAPPKQEPKLVLHVQNIHGNYEAQVQIKKLLEYLYKKYSFKMIFAEGAVEELDPEYLRLFKDKDRNQKLADYMAQRGELTGVELYMMEASKDVRAVGIEEPELYRKNYEAFKKVNSQKDFFSRFLDQYDGRLERLSSLIFSAETRRILTDWQKFQLGQRDFLPYLRRLSQDARKITGLDLESLFAQVEWPQITRLLVIQSMEEDLNPEAAQKEKEKVILFLKEKKVSGEIITAIEKLGEKRITMTRENSEAARLEDLPRYLFERLVQEASPKGFYFHDYPAFSLWAGHLILQSELDSKTLFSEIERVFEKTLNELTVTEPEKNLMELYRDQNLIRKLFSFELTRKEWEKVSYRKEWNHPEAMVSRLAKISSDLNAKNAGLDGAMFSEQEISGQIPGEPSPKNKVEDIYETALNFYDYARQRETVFMDAMKKEMAAAGADKAVLVSGGFHTQGILEMFREDSINYSVLMPRISQEISTENYLAAMMDSRKTMFDVAGLEAINFLQSAVARGEQGVNEGLKVQGLIEDFAKFTGSATLDELVSRFNDFNNSLFASDRKVELITSYDRGGNPYGVRIRINGEFLQKKGMDIVIPISIQDNKLMDYAVLASVESRGKIREGKREDSIMIPPAGTSAELAARSEIRSVSEDLNGEEGGTRMNADFTINQAAETELIIENRVGDRLLSLRSDGVSLEKIIEVIKFFYQNPDRILKPSWRELFASGWRKDLDQIRKILREEPWALDKANLLRVSLLLDSILKQESAVKFLGELEAKLAEIEAFLINNLENDLNAVRGAARDLRILKGGLEKRVFNREFPDSQTYKKFNDKISLLLSRVDEAERKLIREAEVNRLNALISQKYADQVNRVEKKFNSLADDRKKDFLVGLKHSFADTASENTSEIDRKIRVLRSVLQSALESDMETYFRDPDFLMVLSFRLDSAFFLYARSELRDSLRDDVMTRDERNALRNLSTVLFRNPFIYAWAFIVALMTHIGLSVNFSGNSAQSEALAGIYVFGLSWGAFLYSVGRQYFSLKEGWDRSEEKINYLVVRQKEELQKLKEFSLGLKPGFLRGSIEKILPKLDELTALETKTTEESFEKVLRVSRAYSQIDRLILADLSRVSTRSLDSYRKWRDGSGEFPKILEDIRGILLASSDLVGELPKAALDVVFDYKGAEQAFKKRYSIKGARSEVRSMPDSGGVNYLQGSEAEALQEIRRIHASDQTRSAFAHATGREGLLGIIQSEKFGSPINRRILQFGGTAIPSGIFIVSGLIALFTLNPITLILGVSASLILSGIVWGTMSANHTIARFDRAYFGAKGNYGVVFDPSVTGRKTGASDTSFIQTLQIHWNGISGEKHSVYVVPASDKATFLEDVEKIKLNVSKISSADLLDKMIDRFDGELPGLPGFQPSNYDFTADDRSGVVEFSFLSGRDINPDKQRSGDMETLAKFFAQESEYGKEFEVETSIRRESGGKIRYVLTFTPLIIKRILTYEEYARRLNPSWRPVSRSEMRGAMNPGEAKILIVDDETDLADVLKEVLVSAGALEENIRIVSTVREFQTEAISGAYNIIILDNNLASIGLSGLETLRRMKEGRVEIGKDSKGAVVIYNSEERIAESRGLADFAVGKLSRTAVIRSIFTQALILAGERRSELRAVSKELLDSASAVNPENFKIDEAVSSVWNPQAVEKYDLAAYAEAMKKSSGSYATHVVGDSKLNKSILESGHLLPYLVAKARGKSIPRRNGKLGDSFALHFTVNSVFTPFQRNMDTSLVTFFASTESLVQNKGILFAPVENGTPKSDWPVAGLSSDYADASHEFNYNQLGILFVPKEGKAAFEQMLEGVSEVNRPKRVFYFDGRDPARGIRQFLSEYGVKRDGTTRVAQLPQPKWNNYDQATVKVRDSLDVEGLFSRGEGAGQYFSANSVEAESAQARSEVRAYDWGSQIESVRNFYANYLGFTDFLDKTTLQSDMVLRWREFRAQMTPESARAVYEEYVLSASQENYRTAEPVAVITGDKTFPDLANNILFPQTYIADLPAELIASEFPNAELHGRAVLALAYLRGLPANELTALFSARSELRHPLESAMLRNEMVTHHLTSPIPSGLDPSGIVTLLLQNYTLPPSDRSYIFSILRDRIGNSIGPILFPEAPPGSVTWSVAPRAKAGYFATIYFYTFTYNGKSLSVAVNLATGYGRASQVVRNDVLNQAYFNDLGRTGHHPGPVTSGRVNFNHTTEASVDPLLLGRFTTRFGEFNGVSLRAASEFLNDAARKKTTRVLQGNIDAGLFNAIPGATEIHFSIQANGTLPVKWEVSPSGEKKFTRFEDPHAIAAKMIGVLVYFSELQDDQKTIMSLADVFPNAGDWVYTKDDSGSENISIITMRNRKLMQVPAFIDSLIHLYALDEMKTADQLVGEQQIRPVTALPLPVSNPAIAFHGLQIGNIEIYGEVKGREITRQMLDQYAASPLSEPYRQAVADFLADKLPVSADFTAQGFVPSRSELRTLGIKEPGEIQARAAELYTELIAASPALTEVIGSITLDPARTNENQIAGYFLDLKGNRIRRNDQDVSFRIEQDPADPSSIFTFRSDGIPGLSAELVRVMLRMLAKKGYRQVQIRSLIPDSQAAKGQRGSVDFWQTYIDKWSKDGSPRFNVPKGLGESFYLPLARLDSEKMSKPEIAPSRSEVRAISNVELALGADENEILINNQPVKLDARAGNTALALNQALKDTGVLSAGIDSASPIVRFFSGHQTAVIKDGYNAQFIADAVKIGMDAVLGQNVEAKIEGGLQGVAIVGAVDGQGGVRSSRQLPKPLARSLNLSFAGLESTRDQSLGAAVIETDAGQKTAVIYGGNHFDVPEIQDREKILEALLTALQGAGVSVTRRSEVRSASGSSDEGEKTYRESKLPRGESDKTINLARLEELETLARVTEKILGLRSTGLSLERLSEVMSYLSENPERISSWKIWEFFSRNWRRDLDMVRGVILNEPSFKKRGILSGIDGRLREMATREKGEKILAEVSADFARIEARRESLRTAPLSEIDKAKNEVAAARAKLSGISQAATALLKPSLDLSDKLQRLWGSLDVISSKRAADERIKFLKKLKAEKYALQIRNIETAVKSLEAGDRERFLVGLRGHFNRNDAFSNFAAEADKSKVFDGVMVSVMGSDWNKIIQTKDYNDFVDVLTLTFLPGEMGAAGRSEVRTVQSRRTFLQTGLAVAASGFLGLPQQILSQEVKLDAEITALAANLQKGLESYRNARNGLVYNQMVPTRSADIAWIKSGDVGFSLSTLAVRYFNSKDSAAKTAALNMMILALKTHSNLVRDFGLKIAKDGTAGFGARFDGEPTGILPEVLGRDKDYFKAQPDKEGQVAFASFDMALTHERLIYLEGILKAELKLVTGKNAAREKLLKEVLKSLEGILGAVSYRAFIDGDEKLHHSLLVNTKEKKAPSLSKDLVDNKHTEAIAFLALIAKGYLGKAEKSEDRIAEGEKIWDAMKFEWELAAVSDKEKLPIAVGDPDRTTWAEYYAHLFYDIPALAPKTLGVSGQNYFKAAAYAAKVNKHKTVGSAPGTGKDSDTYKPFGLLNANLADYSAVPYGIFMMALSGEEGAKNLKDFLALVKAVGGLSVLYGLMDAYNPRTAKAHNGKVIFMNQALILEVLFRKMLRSDDEVTAFIEKKIKQIETKHAIPEKLLPAPAAEDASVLEPLLKEKKSGVVAKDNSEKYVKGNTPVIDETGKKIELKFLVDGTNTLGGAWFALPGITIEAGHRVLEIAIAEGGKVPSAFKVEFKDEKKTLLGAAAQTSGEIKAGTTLKIDITDIAIAAKGKKISEIVFIFDKAGEGSFTITGIKLTSARSEVRSLGADDSRQETAQPALKVEEARAAWASLEQRINGFIKMPRGIEKSRQQRILMEEVLRFKSNFESDWRLAETESDAIKKELERQYRAYVDMNEPNMGFGIAYYEETKLKLSDKEKLNDLAGVRDKAYFEARRIRERLEEFRKSYPASFTTAEKEAARIGSWDAYKRLSSEVKKRPGYGTVQLMLKLPELDLLAGNPVPGTPAQQVMAISGIVNASAAFSEKDALRQLWTQLFEEVSALTKVLEVDLDDDVKKRPGAVISNLSAKNIGFILPVESRRFQPNVSIGADGRIAVWNGLEIRFFDSNFKEMGKAKIEGMRSAIAFDYRDFTARAAVQRDENTILILNPDTNSSAVTLKTERVHYNSRAPIAFSPDGLDLAVIESANNLKIFNAQTGEMKQSFSLNGFYHSSIAWSPDQSRILLVSDRFVSVLDAVTGAVTRIVEPQRGIFPMPGEFAAAAFSPDGQNILTFDDAGNSDLWKLSTGERIFHKYENFPHRLRSISVLPDVSQAVMLRTNGDLEVVKLEWTAEEGDDEDVYDLSRSEVRVGYDFSSIWVSNFGTSSLEPLLLFEVTGLSENPLSGSLNLNRSSREGSADQWRLYFGGAIYNLSDPKTWENPFIKNFFTSLFNNETAVQIILQRSYWQGLRALLPAEIESKIKASRLIELNQEMRKSRLKSIAQSIWLSLTPEEQAYLKKELRNANKKDIGILFEEAVSDNPELDLRISDLEIKLAGANILSRKEINRIDALVGQIASKSAKKEDPERSYLSTIEIGKIDFETADFEMPELSLLARLIRVDLIALKTGTALRILLTSGGAMAYYSPGSQGVVELNKNRGNKVLRDLGEKLSLYPEVEEALFKEFRVNALKWRELAESGRLPESWAAVILKGQSRSEVRAQDGADKRLGNLVDERVLVVDTDIFKIMKIILQIRKDPSKDGFVFSSAQASDELIKIVETVYRDKSFQAVYSSGAQSLPKAQKELYLDYLEAAFPRISDLIREGLTPVQKGEFNLKIKDWENGSGGIRGLVKNFLDFKGVLLPEYITELPTGLSYALRHELLHDAFSGEEAAFAAAYKILLAVPEVRQNLTALFSGSVYANDLDSDIKNMDSSNPRFKMSDEVFIQLFYPSAFLRGKPEFARLRSEVAALETQGAAEINQVMRLIRDTVNSHKNRVKTLLIRISEAYPNSLAAAAYVEAAKGAGKGIMNWEQAAERIRGSLEKRGQLTLQVLGGEFPITDDLFLLRFEVLMDRYLAKLIELKLVSSRPLFSLDEASLSSGSVILNIAGDAKPSEGARAELRARKFDPDKAEVLGSEFVGNVERLIESRVPGYRMVRPEVLAEIFDRAKFSDQDNFIEFMGDAILKFSIIQYFLKTYPAITRQALQKIIERAQSSSGKKQIILEASDFYAGYKRLAADARAEITYTPQRLSALILGHLFIENDFQTAETFLTEYFKRFIGEQPPEFGKGLTETIKSREYEANMNELLDGTFIKPFVPFDAREAFEKVLRPPYQKGTPSGQVATSQRYARLGDAVQDLALIRMLISTFGRDGQMPIGEMNILLSDLRNGSTHQALVGAMFSKLISNGKVAQSTLFEGILAAIYLANGESRGKGIDQAESFIREAFRFYLEQASDTEKNKAVYKTINSFVNSRSEVRLAPAPEKSFVGKAAFIQEGETTVYLGMNWFEKLMNGEQEWPSDIKPGEVVALLVGLLLLPDVAYATESASVEEAVTNLGVIAAASSTPEIVRRINELIAQNAVLKVADRPSAIMGITFERPSDLEGMALNNLLNPSVHTSVLYILPETVGRSEVRRIQQELDTETAKIQAWKSASGAIGNRFRVTAVHSSAVSTAVSQGARQLYSNMKKYAESKDVIKGKSWDGLKGMAMDRFMEKYFTQLFMGSNVRAAASDFSHPSAKRVLTLEYETGAKDASQLNTAAVNVAVKLTGAEELSQETAGLLDKDDNFNVSKLRAYWNQLLQQALEALRSIQRSA